jgi:hypothetical protein
LTARGAGFDDDSPMAPLTREPPEPPNPPGPACVRCSKPIAPGTGSQISGRPIHMRCMAGDTRLKAIEHQDRASREVARATAAIDEANTLVNPVRRKQTHCAACREPFGMSRGLLFQGDRLVHGACWRADPKPFDDPPPAG